ncbi:MAG: hypothetical protein ABIC40_04955 [bacterium]
MSLTAILLATVVVIVIYIGNKYLKDLRAVRRELADGKTLSELDEMANESREKLLGNFEDMSKKLDRRLERLDKLHKEAEGTIGRLEALLKNERLKTLEERGILFAIEAGENANSEKDRSKRIADLLRNGASIEEVSRITEASIREIELIRLLLKRREKNETA